MPSAADIQRYILGAWRMMNGKPEGVRLLDISADGFWNSFLSIFLALPPLIVLWVTLTNGVATEPVPVATRLSLVLRLAVMGVGAWIVPLIGFVVVSRRVGLADKVVQYVISSNWGDVVLDWMLLPPLLLRMIYPPADHFATIIMTGVYTLTVVLKWRLTNSAIGRGGTVATAVFVAMFVAVIVVEYLLQTVLGLGALSLSPA